MFVFAPSPAGSRVALSFVRKTVGPRPHRSAAASRRLRRPMFSGLFAPLGRAVLCASPLPLALRRLGARCSPEISRSGAQLLPALGASRYPSRGCSAAPAFRPLWRRSYSCARLLCHSGGRPLCSGAQRSVTLGCSGAMSMDGAPRRSAAPALPQHSVLPGAQPSRSQRLAPLALGCSRARPVPRIASPAP